MMETLPAPRATRPHTKYKQLSVRRSQLKPEYDSIVIGAGIGGLICGSYLARFGARVLIVERHWVPGGLCSFFKRKGFFFDAGAHYFGGLGDRKSFGGMLLRGLDLDVEFINIDPVDILHFPDRTIELPANIESHISLLQTTFPLESESIRAFFSEMLRIYRHFYRGRTDSPLLSRYRWTAYQETLDSFFTDAKLKAILSATVGYVGLYPNQTSTIAMASMMMSYFYDGGYVARGGSQALPDSIMRRFTADGGDLSLGTAVERITVDHRHRVESVILASGEEVRATSFVCNADARQTFLRMIGEERVGQEYVQALRGYHESNSCFILYLGIECEDEPLKGKRGWHFDGYDMNSSENIPLYVAIPTLEDRSLCPPGHHILIATTLCDEPFDADKEQSADRRRRYEQETLRRLESIIPGVARKIVVKENAGKRTIHKYTLNHHGAMYGWESSPSQFWLNRLPIETPFENLLLCGHWASIGPGVISVAACGLLAARAAAQMLEKQDSRLTEAPA
jgi:phytoene dehydrogenase-like protein